MISFLFVSCLAYIQTQEIQYEIQCWLPNALFVDSGCKQPITGMVSPPNNKRLISIFSEKGNKKCALVFKNSSKELVENINIHIFYNNVYVYVIW